MEGLLRDPRVTLVQNHQCRFGLVAPLRDGTDAVGPAEKPTGFMTNSCFVAESLNKQCGQDHVHVPLTGGRAAGAAIHPHDRCESVCSGLLKQNVHGTIQKHNNFACAMDILLRL